jgi:TetR/AcrR family transcriptional repressor of nem operon
MAKTETRAAIVAIASQLLRVNGFNGTGIDMVLKKAKVPKGSFYYYFKSKDDLGFAIIEDAAHELARKLEHHLGDHARAPLQRLRSYFESSIEVQRQSACTRGCLFGTLGLELASRNNRLRQRIAAVFTSWEIQVAACLKEAQRAGALPRHWVPAELAAFILSSWEGAILRAKVDKTVEPMTRFVDILFDRVLQN